MATQTNMKRMIEIAKKLHDANENCCLTGTLMLKMRGIDLGREPKDIDILVNGEINDFKFPDGIDTQKISEDSSGEGIKLKCGDFIVDLLPSEEKPEVVNGFRVGSVKCLMDAKYNYSKQDNPSAQKHHADLVKMGYVFPNLPELSDNGMPF